MKAFIHDDFLLHNRYAKELYHSYAEIMPVCDFHCHLFPSDIAADIRYATITEAWLSGDHYKWRAMRFAGVEETYITGSADPKDKFLKWAEVLPGMLGNPLYHWTHLELARYFNTTKLLNKENAEYIWTECNEQLEDPSFSARGLIKRSNVVYIATTDDPADTLEYHKKIHDEHFETKVVPTFRPDPYTAIGAETFCESVSLLASSENIHAIPDFSGFLNILNKRVACFKDAGCVLADISLEIIDFKETQAGQAEKIYNRAVNGEELSTDDVIAFQSFMLVHLGKIYHSSEWIMQLHVGALRNNNTRMLHKVGINTGFDSTNDQPVTATLAKILDCLDKTDQLPVTIVYGLNPAGNNALGSLIGSYQGGGIPGKVQLGAAWWFNDHIPGMRDQLQAFASLGILGVFIGMVTDSRSFLSYTRHEYFRRILCRLLGEWMESGIVPDNIEEVGNVVSDLSFNNARKFLSF